MSKTNKQNVSTITKMPDCFLRLKGWFNAFRGETVVDANIDRYYDRLYAIEHEEVSCTEAGLYSARTNAANCISLINSSTADIAASPPILAEENDTAVRTNQKNRSEKNRAMSSIASSTTTIVEANELIISESVRLQERIEKTRDLAEEKISTYISGVRSNKRLREYVMKTREAHNPVEFYEEKHRILDEAIKAIAYRIVKEAE